MTVSADQLRDLLALGIEGEQLLAVVAIFDRDTRHDASRRVTVSGRSKEAERSARYREKLKQNQASAKANDVAAAGDQGVTTDRDASRRTVTPPCNLSSFLPVSGSGIREKESKKVARARGTRMTHDMVLHPDWRAFAVSAGVRAVDTAFSEFKDYWIAIPGTRGTKLDWFATWRNRCRMIGAKNNGQGNVIASADKLIEKLAEINRPAPSGELFDRVRGGTGAADVRLLPSRGRE